MKLTIVGGGGFRVPLVYGALLAKRETLPFDEVVLHDLDAGRMERMAGVLRGLAQERGAELPFRATTDLDDAVEGADFVFSAIRVGRLEGRVVDESVPLARGVLGQETTGPGGICFALRTIPEMLKLATTVAERAPGAWVINFTNPAGMVTEALQQVLGDRVVGICDSPSGLCRRVARAVGHAPRRHVVRLLRPQPPRLAAGGARRRHRPAAGAARRRRASSAAFEEGRLFGGDWLRALGMIPNEYLYYFYFHSDAVESIRKGVPRGAQLLESQAAFYARNGDDALAEWRATRAERDRTYMAAERLAAGVEADHDDGGDGGGYEGEAMAVVEAIANNTRAIMILNTANRSALPFLDERAVVEVPCIVGRTGPVPVAVGSRPRPRAGAHDRHQGRRAHDDPGGPDRLRRPRDPRARAAPARPQRPDRARHLRRLPRAAPRAGGALREMSVDVVVTATAFMDITFIGLESVPRPGEERFAGDLLRSPGGGAINAVGVSRLGLHCRARGPARRGPRRQLHPRRARARGHRARHRRRDTHPDDRGDAVGRRARDGHLRARARARAPPRSPTFDPRAVIVALDQLDLVPPGVRGYATCGDDDARAFQAHPPRDLDRARALFVNRREALLITGEQTAEKAAEVLAADVEIVVVTLGPEGAMARSGDRVVHAPGFEMKVVDTTGAGDLLCAAFVWADLQGADIEVALRWAVLYGSLSVTVPTGFAGAVTQERLMEEGTTRGLPPLATHKETRT